MVISNRSNAAGHQTNEADMRGICELVEVLRDAVIEYQVSLRSKAHGQLVEFVPEHWIVCTAESSV